MSLKKPPGAWALNFTQCVRCGKNDTRHMAKGLCRRCYFEDYTKDNGTAIKGYKRKWYIANGGAVWSKALREQQNYGGLREAALKRDGYKCVKCGATTQLCVHHKDGRGRSVPRPLKNNTLENLETLCRKHHLEAHRKEYIASQNSRLAVWWCYKWRLQECIGCNRSDRKHQSQGYCSTCAARLKIRKPTRKDG